MSFKRRKKFNPKRIICAVPSNSWLADVLAKVEYTGNPEHKRNPSDFGLTPPASPRAGKSLCDDAGIFKKKDAKSYLSLALEMVLLANIRLLTCRKTSGLLQALKEMKWRLRLSWKIGS